MANEEHLKILNEGVEVWNAWRAENPEVEPDLSGAILTRKLLARANLEGANLAGANLTGALLLDANLRFANVTGANLRGALLLNANLAAANLTGANLRGAELGGANLVTTNVQNAELTGCAIWGISVWDLQGVPKDQSNLVITPSSVAAVTVDDLKVAQFVYLLLYNPNIRDVIDTIGKKGVLVLGRFGKRKKVLDALRETLREAGLAPIVFDFERAESLDFTETVVTLAGMSAFIIADITNPKSVQQELQATIPNYMIPFVPIIQEGEPPYSMFVDFLKKYDKWVLKPLKYTDLDQLERITYPAIIEPALKRRELLLSEKDKELEFRPGEDYERSVR